MAPVGGGDAGLRRPARLQRHMGRRKSAQRNESHPEEFRRPFPQSLRFKGLQNPLDYLPGKIGDSCVSAVLREVDLIDAIAEARRRGDFWGLGRSTLKVER